MDEKKQHELMELYETIRNDPHYRSQNMGTTFVPGSGSMEENPIVFIGEAPGQEEERKRTPFVGPAGRNLGALLQGIGLSRQEVFITNLVKYRPFTKEGANRAPSIIESRYALPYLLRELAILNPRLVVCLGLSSAKALLEDPTLKMGDANSRIFQKHGMKILVTFHPSPYNYKIPEKKEAMEAAFQVLKDVVKLESPGTSRRRKTDTDN